MVHGSTAQPLHSGRQASGQHRGRSYLSPLSTKSGPTSSPRGESEEDEEDDDEDDAEDAEEEAVWTPETVRERRRIQTAQAGMATRLLVLVMLSAC